MAQPTVSAPKKVFYLLLAFFGLVITPYIGAYIHVSGVFDKHYFDFPPLSAELIYKDQTPANGGFSWTVFWGVMVIAFLTLLLYVFPRLFGFKAPPAVAKPPAPRPRVPFPTWFWAGTAVWAVTAIFLAGHFTSPKWFLNWAYIPLYWGFTFMLDGIVYKRTGGRSIFNNAPQELVGIGVASIFGWLIFEYLNFFVQEYWYYPIGGVVPDDEWYTYAIFASSALMPLSFQWFSLFNTFPGWVAKYRYGPKISLGRTAQVGLLVVAFAALFLMPMFPTYLCPVIWLAPLIILTVALDLLGIWTPFTPIRNGVWTPVLFLALTYLVEGFLLEGQNYMSATHTDGVAHTDYLGYWVYNVPFVDRFHVFEMPVAGFYGYLPFGIYCLVWWIFFAYLLGIPSNFAKYEDPVY